MTQSQNEAVNGQLWSRCSKMHFCGKRRVTIAVCETVTVSNTGAGSQATFLENSGIPLGLNTLRGLRQKEKSRLTSAAQNVSDRYLTARLRKRRSGKNVQDGCTPKSYIPGGFESAIPETCVKKTPLKSRTASKRKWVQSTRVRKASLSDLLFKETEDTQMCANIHILCREPLFERLRPPKKKKGTYVH